MQIVSRLERLSLAKEEYLVLKALVLVNSDAHVDEFPPLKQLRDQVTAALQDCVAVLRYIPSHSVTRMHDIMQYHLYYTKYFLYLLYMILFTN